MQVYFNNAASGFPRAPGVAEAVQHALLKPPHSHGRGSEGHADPQAECRASLARVLDVADPSRIVLTSGATLGLNLAILGLNLPAGARVVASVMEHNSVLRPLARLQQERGISVSYLGLNADGLLDQRQFSKLLQPAPALVVLVHASNVTGQVNDVAPLFSAAKAAGAVTLLDASQSVGIHEVHPRELQADLVAFTCHKGFHGPPGTGALYVAPELELQQVIVGGTGVRGDLTLHPPEMPMRLEAGTPNMPAFAGLAAALRWHSARTADAVAQEHALADRLRIGLRVIPGVKVYGPAAPHQATGAVSFHIAGWSVADAGHALSDSFGIECRSGLHCAPLIHAALGSAPEGTLRLSVSGFNTSEELAYVLDAVAQLAAQH